MRATACWLDEADDIISGEMLAVEAGDPLESKIQADCVTHARHYGAYARKFSSPANRSVPDDIFAWEGLIWFVEFKRLGKKPTDAQIDEHEKIRAAGGVVWVIDKVADFKDRFTRVRGKLALHTLPTDFRKRSKPKTK